MGGFIKFFFSFRPNGRSATSKNQPFILFVHPFKCVFLAHQIFLRTRDLVDCVRVACKGMVYDDMTCVLHGQCLLQFSVKPLL